MTLAWKVAYLQHLFISSRAWAHGDQPITGMGLKLGSVGTGLESGIICTDPVPVTMVAVWDNVCWPNAWYHGCQPGQARILPSWGLDWPQHSLGWAWCWGLWHSCVLTSFSFPHWDGIFLYVVPCGFREGDADNVKLPFLPLPGHGISVLQPGAVISHLGSLLLWKHFPM